MPFLLAAFILSGNGAPLSSPALQRPEYELKAAFLYKFGSFVTWPNTAFPDKESPLVLAVLGKDPFGPDLEKVVGQDTIRGRPISIVRAPEGAAPPDCHILFIANSEKRRVRTILDAVASKPILTVADMDPFCRLGGMIRFTMRGNKLNFHMNPTAARKAKLRIGSELLSIARIIETDPGKEGAE